MTERIHIDRIFEELNSMDILTQNEALDEAAGLMKLIAEKAVAAFESSSEPYFVYERMHRFGPHAGPPLLKLLQRTKDSKIKTLVSMSLWKLGSREGLGHLLDAILNDNAYSCLAARQLADAKVPEAWERIIARLEKCDLEEVDLIICLLHALEEYQEGIPPFVLTRFESFHNSDSPKLKFSGLFGPYAKPQKRPE